MMYFTVTKLTATPTAAQNKANPDASGDIVHVRTMAAISMQTTKVEASSCEIRMTYSAHAPEWAYLFLFLDVRDPSTAQRAL